MILVFRFPLDEKIAPSCEGEATLETNFSHFFVYIFDVIGYPG